MNQALIHVYLMPGMAANPSIFEYIALPKETFKLYYITWEIPLKQETIEEYAFRMCKKIKHVNSVLIGVSFGGVLVQEMSKFLQLKRLIIISSVKSKHELPTRLTLARKTRAYKLVPTRLMSNINLLAKYAFGETITKRVELYKKYLSISNKDYLDWAIEQMVCWDRDEADKNVIHIHGDKDAVFPIVNIKDCINIKGGTHIMIINKYKWFNENLPLLILND